MTDGLSVGFQGQERQCHAETNAACSPQFALLPAQGGAFTLISHESHSSRLTEPAAAANSMP